MAPHHLCRSGGNQLAVLHPRKMVVYGVQAAGSSFLQLAQLYEQLVQYRAAMELYQAQLTAHQASGLADPVPSVNAQAWARPAGLPSARCCTNDDTKKACSKLR